MNATFGCWNIRLLAEAFGIETGNISVLEDIQIDLTEAELTQVDKISSCLKHRGGKWNKGQAFEKLIDPLFKLLPLSSEIKIFHDSLLSTQVKNRILNSKTDLAIGSIDSLGNLASPLFSLGYYHTEDFGEYIPFRQDKTPTHLGAFWSSMITTHYLNHQKVTFGLMITDNYWWQLSAFRGNKIDYTTLYMYPSNLQKAYIWLKKVITTY